MSEQWALEFVGGPLDGTRDMMMPVTGYEVTHHTTLPQPMNITTVANDVPLHAPPIYRHRYRLGVWRSRQGKWRVDQDIWLYVWEG